MGQARLIIGNIATAGITLAAFLQLLPWSVAGLLVLISTVLASLPRRAFTKSQNTVPAKSMQAAAVKPPAKSPHEGEIEKPQHRPEKALAEPSQGTTPERKREAKPARQKKTAVMAPPVKAAAPKGLQIEDSDRGVPRKIPVDDYLSINVELEAGDEVVCEVEASGIVNAYVLTDDSLANLDLGGEFWYEAGSEEVRSATVRFTAQEEGKWFIVVENAGEKEVSTTVRVRVNRESHEAPLLKTENLGLPTEGLQGKL